MPVLAKIISCLSGRLLVRPELLVHLPDALGVDDADLALGRRRQARDVLLGVDVDPADEDAVDRLEGFERSPPLRTAPDGVAGRDVLPRA